MYKVSILTVVKNNFRQIDLTIQSVINQSIKNKEFYFAYFSFNCYDIFFFSKYLNVYIKAHFIFTYIYILFPHYFNNAIFAEHLTQQFL
jgi:hypothetical protein